MSKLNQIIAVEKGVKTRVNSVFSNLYKVVQKPALFEGFAKTWSKANEEEGEDRPNERKKVQVKAEEILDQAKETLVELFDITATKDFANCAARADIVVNGEKLLSDVPVSYLLFLEKQINDVKTFVGKLPTLSTDEDWARDEALNLYKTAGVESHSTKKVKEVLVKYPATTEFPAQTEVVDVDKVVGRWVTVKQSGAALESRKKTILKRCELLLEAVKFAREEANNTEANRQSVGEKVFDFLLA